MHAATTLAQHGGLYVLRTLATPVKRKHDLVVNLQVSCLMEAMNNLPL